MLYCQHVLGIGHFFRSMAIARALAEHEVLFVEGGEPITGFEPPRHVRRLLLPPLMMDPEFQRLEAGPSDLDQVKQERKRMLLEALETFSPQVLLTELFPFGRNTFRFELIPLLEAIQQRGRATRVLCSLRDILVEKRDQAAYEERVLSRLNAYYDGVLAHSDPRLFSLAETFSRVEAIDPPIHYTGYVVREGAPAGPRPRLDSPNRVVVVSTGGGRVGVDLLSACILAMKDLPAPDLRMRVFLGPFLESEGHDALRKLASHDSRVSLHPFASDFVAELRWAALSISMAGYNTCMDLLVAGARALVYPFPQNREQLMRALKLQQLGLARTLDSLEPALLAQAVTTALSAPRQTTAVPIDLNGARTTARLVERYGSAAATGRRLPVIV